MSRLKKLRVEDPVLTNIALGYYNNELVGEVLFPVVEIEKEAGTIPQFGREAFKLHTTVRALRGKSNRIEPEDISSLNVNLEEQDLEYPIDYRENHEAAYPHKKYATRTIQDLMALKREKEIADLATNEATYEQSNKVVLSSMENMLVVFDEAIQTIKSQTGKSANTVVISSEVWSELARDRGLLERIKYTQTGILTPELLATLLKVKTVKVAAAQYEESNELKPIWGKCIIAAYVPEGLAGKHNVYEPAYGYTVRRKGSLVVDTYQEVGGKVEIVRVTDVVKPYLVGKSAGYLIKVQ